MDLPIKFAIGDQAVGVPKRQQFRRRIRSRRRREVRGVRQISGRQTCDGLSAQIRGHRQIQADKDRQG